MSPEEYRKQRKKAKLTLMGLTKLLGVHHMTVWRREKGDLPITREAELALLAVTAEMEHQRTVELLRDALDVIARNVATERSGSRKEPCPRNPAAFGSC